MNDFEKIRGHCLLLKDGVGNTVCYVHLTEVHERMSKDGPKMETGDPCCSVIDEALDDMRRALVRRSLGRGTKE